MKQQTAVEWLQEVIINHLSHEQQMQLEGLFQQAKEIEKEQLKDAYWNGTIDIDKKDALLNSEEWFNESYKK